jgi:hypothetical protein
MTLPPNYLNDLGTQAQMMGKNCHDKRIAMAFQCVALGSVLIMAGSAAIHLVQDLSAGWRREPGPDNYWELREKLNRLEKAQQGRPR